MEGILTAEAPGTPLVKFYAANWCEVLKPWCASTVPGELVLLISRLRDAEEGFGPLPSGWTSDQVPPISRLVKWLRHAYRKGSTDVSPWNERISRVWESRETDLEGEESVGRLISWEDDIHGAKEVELGNLCQALDSANVKIAGVDNFWSEAADESDLQDGMLKLWRVGYGPRAFAGFRERYAFFSLPEKLIALKKEFVASACRRLSMEECLGMCRILSVPEARFAGAPLGVVRQLLSELQSTIPTAERGPTFDVPSQAAVQNVGNVVVGRTERRTDTGDGERLGPEAGHLSQHGVRGPPGAARDDSLASRLLPGRTCGWY